MLVRSDLRICTLARGMFFFFFFIFFFLNTQYSCAANEGYDGPPGSPGGFMGVQINLQTRLDTCCGSLADCACEVPKEILLQIGRGKPRAPVRVSAKS